MFDFDRHRLDPLHTLHIHIITRHTSITDVDNISLMYSCQ